MIWMNWAGFVSPIVTATIAIFALVVVRGTKISELRQKWIDDQRTDLATVLAYGKMIEAGELVDPAGTLLQFDKAYNRICLRENPVEKDWQSIIRRIHRLRAAYHPTAKQPIQVECNDVLVKSQKLLKAEWNRTRDGESGYRLLILLAATLILLPFLPPLIEALRR